MNILLTGGAGYIGSHTALALAESGYGVVTADNFSNSSPESIRRVRELTGAEIPCIDLDIRNTESLIRRMREYEIDGVIHFAGLKAVGESVRKPVEYYENNLDTTLSLLRAMKACGVSRLIFSSSATVYGSENPVPYTEAMPRGTCSNPYGWTKAMIEQILTDAAAASHAEYSERSQNKTTSANAGNTDPAADPTPLRVVLLRYFNPIGAHESGRIGEDPSGIPNNLMPYITQVAVGRRKELTVFGGDYDTPDGTCLRDYIHVMDLAEGHVAAVRYLESGKECADAPGTLIVNLGTGTPYSVLDLVHTFEAVNGISVPHHIGDRRDGDLPAVYAKVDKAREVLGWTAKRDLADMCRDAWNWQRNNPNGYRENAE